MTDDRSLQLAIAYALGTTTLRPKSRVAADNDREKMAAARVILDHLKLSGYTITKKAEDKPHSIP